MSWSADTRLHPQQRLDTKWIKTDLQVILRTLILTNIPSLTEELPLKLTGEIKFIDSTGIQLFRTVIQN
jgi:hypothetical protein